MKKVYLLPLLALLVGCASINIPNYVRPEKPYRKKFEFSYQKTLKATQEALASAGWVIADSVDPSVYERSVVIEGENVNRVLIITEVRQLGFFLGTRYARVNVNLHSSNDISTEVEIRYLTANSMGFKTFYNYRHDKTAERLLRSIEKTLSLPN